MGLGIRKNITREDGAILPNLSVGLHRKNKIVRQSFSNEFREYLNSLEDWFKNLDDFRNALAHRIPLYIPPYVITVNDIEEYNNLESEKLEALQHQQFAEHERLNRQQNAFKVFHPVMIHSIGEGSPREVFHAQILADFNTIDEISRKLIEELNK